MKKYLLLICAVVLIVTGCSKKRGFYGEEARETLLSTVPKSTNAVMLVDLESLNSALGNKVDGGKIQVGSVLKNYCDMLGDEGQQTLKFLADNDAGLIYSSAACFEHNGTVVATFFVEDEKAFADYVQKTGNLALSQQDGVTCNEEKGLFIRDNQVWIADRGAVKAKDVVVFLNLKEEESFVSFNISEQLVKSKDVLTAIADTEGLSTLLGSQGFTISSALTVAFDNAKYICFTANFVDGKAVADITVLNNNFKPAPLAVKLDKVDMQTINSFTGKGDQLFAFAPSQQSISNLLNQFSGMGVIPADSEKALRMLDGTIIASYDIAASMKSPSMSIMLTFGGDNATKIEEAEPAVKQLLGVNMLGTVEGNHLLLTYGEPSSISIENLKKRFEGSYGGYVISTQGLSSVFNFNLNEYISVISLLLLPNENGVKIQLTLDTRKGQNSLVSIMQVLMEMQKSRSKVFDSSFTQPEEDSSGLENMYSEGDEELIDIDSVL